VEGVKTGKWDYFYDTGKIKEKISYHNGTPVGEYKVFSEKGTVIEKGKYEEGVRINK
jgi:antitoxin component YwqK of YwqJK toxin-antitoxin module